MPIAVVRGGSRCTQPPFLSRHRDRVVGAGISPFCVHNEQVSGVQCVVERIGVSRFSGDGWRLSKEEEGTDGNLALQESRPELQRPPLYRVVLLNDDYTPMEFVVEVLEVFFRMNREQATHVMLTVHTQGKGVCGIYTRDIAETKAAQVNQYSRDNEHPLLCEIEASEG